jgi:hypothetical protein
MSTLIERMILRTHAPLSALEPITPPRYASASPTQAPDVTVFTELPSAPAGVPDYGLPQSSSTSASQTALLGDSQRNPRPDPPETASPGSVRPDDLPTVLAGQDRRAELSRAESVPDNEPQRDNESRPGALSRPGEDRNLPAVRPLRRTAETPPIAVTARRRSTDLAGYAAAAAPPAAITGTDDHARGPDVSVTIGHIEVRAASPAPARPARTPFRPQVTLTDFLSNGHRSRR